VLISPYITPGTVSNQYYNHYSWLATMEDLFNVDGGNAHAPLSPGAVSVLGGLDGLGHLGYAAQPGLRPFGPGVFTSPSGSSSKGGQSFRRSPKRLSSTGGARREAGPGSAGLAFGAPPLL
jgi:Phosphoesterase family